MKLEEIERLCANAIRFPWKVNTLDICGYETRWGVGYLDGSCVVDSHCEDHQPDNMESIVAFRMLMPKLLAVAKAAKYMFQQKYMNTEDDWAPEINDVRKALEELEKD